jgi:hypothetical protein
MLLLRIEKNNLYIYIDSPHRKKLGFYNNYESIP